MDNFICKVCWSVLETQIVDGKYVQICPQCREIDKNIQDGEILYSEVKEETDANKFPILANLSKIHPRIKKTCPICKHPYLIAFLDEATLTRDYICEKCGEKYQGKT